MLVFGDQAKLGEDFGPCPALRGSPASGLEGAQHVMRNWTSVSWWAPSRSLWNGVIYNLYKWPKINGFHWGDLTLVMWVITPIITIQGDRLVDTLARDNWFIRLNISWSKGFQCFFQMFLQWKFSRKSMAGGLGGLTAGRFFCNSVCGKQIGGSPPSYNSLAMARTGSSSGTAVGLLVG